MPGREKRPSVKELTLETPSVARAESFVRLRDAHLAAGEDDWQGRHALAHTDVAAWIELINRRARGEDVPEGWVREAQYWVIFDGEVVGDVELRDPLNDWLTQVGGNIGYATHPAYRRRGIATFALRQGLRILATWGVTQALATCRDDNVPSIKTIESAGGIRIDDARYDGPKRRRYLIPTPA